MAPVIGIVSTQALCVNDINEKPTSMMCGLLESNDDELDAFDHGKKGVSST